MIIGAIIIVILIYSAVTVLAIKIPTMILIEVVNHFQRLRNLNQDLVSILSAEL